MCVHCTGGLLSRRVSSQPADANLNAHANVANAEPSWQVNPPPPPPQSTPVYTPVQHDDNLHLSIAR